jgi:hypothetical protein
MVYAATVSVGSVLQGFDELVDYENLYREQRPSYRTVYWLRTPCSMSCYVTPSIMFLGNCPLFHLYVH